MASWADLGHAIRRRAGLPSNHFSTESAVSNYTTVDQATQAAAAAGSAKIPVGVTGSLTPPAGRGTARPRGNTQAGNPSADPKANRSAVEHNGAAYRITANIAPQHDPTAGPTLASAKIVSSVHGRNAVFSEQRGLDSNQ